MWDSSQSPKWAWNNGTPGLEDGSQKGHRFVAFCISGAASPVLRARKRRISCALEAPREFAFVKRRPIVRHHDDRRISPSHPVDAADRNNIDMEAALDALSYPAAAILFERHRNR
jgi:hypothetical protein